MQSHEYQTDKFNDRSEVRRDALLTLIEFVAKGNARWTPSKEVTVTRWIVWTKKEMSLSSACLK